MTARPGNWSLIADSGADPVPGDPAAVLHEANYYSSMAETILAEAHRLQTLGQDGDLVGKYKKSLQQELGDLAGEVHKAHKRYEGVGTALKPYAAALDDARTESWGALQDAVQAHSAQTSANGMPNPQPTGGTSLTAAQKTDQKNRTTAINSANAALSRAQHRLHNALAELNTAGKRAAGQINSNDNDALKDHHHWWDVIVKIMKVVVEILNYAVIVLAVAALIFSGGWIFVALVIASVAILALDTTLAATGNGSWFDVGLDIVGLLTLGTGKAAEEVGAFAAKGAARAATREIAGEAAKGEGALTRVATHFSRMSNARSIVSTFTEAAGQTKFLDRLAVGSKDMAESLSKVQALARAFPDSEKIAQRLATVKTAAAWSKGSFRTGNSLITGNLALSKSTLPWIEDHKWSFGPLEGLKEILTGESRYRAVDFRWSQGAPVH